MQPNLLSIKKERALRRLRRGRRLLVALSGGVDSAVLLSLALEALGADRILAATGRSASLPAGELDDARRVARSLGVPHEVVETRELQLAGYRANAGDRCFHCRNELFAVLGDLARRRGLHEVVYGAIADDLGDFRPGMTAAEDHGVGAPLLEAGLTKPEIRALAAEAGLQIRDKPAAACLSSRIPVGTEVTPERLGQVDRAEAALRGLGFGQLRVRHHGPIARLELDPEGQRRILDSGVKARVVAAVREAGFRFVALDLEGYRTGSLNPTGKRRD